MKCTQTYGKVTDIFLLNNYQHILSKKIRIHLYKKSFESMGVKEPLRVAKEYTHNRSMY